MGAPGVQHVLTPASVRGLVGLAALLLGASLLSACDNGPDLPGAAAQPTTPRAPPPTRRLRDRSDSEDEPPAGSIRTNVKRKADVPVDTAAP